MTDDTIQSAPRSNSTLPGLPLEELVTALARSALFRDVEPAQLRLLAFSAEERLVAAGEVIAEAGTYAAPAYLVSGGRVLVDGSVVGPGALIHAPGAMTSGVIPCRVEAKTQGRLLVINRPLVSRLIGEYPTMGRAMMRSLGQDLRILARGIRAQARPAQSATHSTSQPTVQPPDGQ